MSAVMQALVCGSQSSGTESGFIFKWDVALITLAVALLTYVPAMTYLLGALDKLSANLAAEGRCSKNSQAVYFPLWANSAQSAGSTQRCSGKAIANGPNAYLFLLSERIAHVLASGPNVGECGGCKSVNIFLDRTLDFSGE